VAREFNGLAVLIACPVTVARTMLWMNHHTLAAISITGTCLDVLGSLYLAYDLLGGQHGPLRLLTRAVTYSIVFGIGYGAGLGLFLVWLRVLELVSLCRLNSIERLGVWIITHCRGKRCLLPFAALLSAPDSTELWGSVLLLHSPSLSPSAKSSRILAACVRPSTIRHRGDLALPDASFGEP
jgi:hypothetical protein